MHSQKQNNTKTPSVRVGVGVIVIKNGKILLGKRKSAHGEGKWSYPGGHLEFNESIEECARRETLEETGMTIKNIRRGIYTEDQFVETNKHYITITVVADWESGTPQVCEPEKCAKWEWFSWDSLPKELFLPTINQKKMGWSPFTNT